MPSMGLFFVLLCLSQIYFADDSVKFNPKRSFHVLPFMLELEIDNSFSEMGSVDPIFIRYTVSTFSINASLNTIANTKHPTIVDNPTIVGNGIANCPTYPSLTVGQTYSSPFQIKETSIIKAIAYRRDLVTKSIVASELITHTYVFPEDVMKQNTMGGGVLARYGNESYFKSFLVIPTMLISSAGPYPLEDDRQIDQPIRDPPRPPGQVEWIDWNRPKDTWLKQSEYFRRGGYTRRLKKKSIKVEFTDGNLDFDLFNTRDPMYSNGQHVRSAKRVDKFILRVSSDNSFYSYLTPVLYFRGIWNDVVMQDLGLKLVHSRLIHLYFNSQYQGIMTLREIIDNDWMREYCGGNKTEYETIDQVYVGDPAVEPTPFFDSMVANRGNWDFLKPRMDWEAFFAFHVHMHFEVHLDIGDQHNWQGGGRNFLRVPGTDDHCNWRFFLHDNDAAFYDYGTGNASTANYLLPNMHVNWVNGHKRFFMSLVEANHPDFKNRLWDFVYKSLDKKNGLLTPEGNQNRWKRIINSFTLNMSIMPEVSRWGYINPSQWTWRTVIKYPNGFYQEDYVDGLNKIYDNYFPARTPFFRSLYVTKGWVNPNPAPVLNLDDDSIVNEGTKFTITAAAGNTIVYTTNEEDPRLENGGAVNPRAISSPAVDIALSDTTTFYSRQRTASGEWGPLDISTIRVKKRAGCVLCRNLIITELNYRHKVTKFGPSDNLNSPDATFIEFKNIGLSPLVLTGSKLDSGSIKYNFPAVTLAPGKFWVIARFVDDFQLAYGVYPNGTFTGEVNYEKGDHAIRIMDSVGNLVHELTYSKELPWSELPNGNGYSLVANVEDYLSIANRTKESTAKNYRASVNKNGSPWSDDTPTPPPMNIGIKITFVNFDKEWIEIHNPSATKTLDLSLWAIKESFNAPADEGFYFPKGTKLAPLSKIKASGNGLKLNKGKALAIFDTTLIDSEYVYTGRYYLWDPEVWAMALN